MKKGMIVVAVALLIMMLVGACSAEPEPEGIQLISPEEAWKNLAEDPDIVLVDVRTPQEYEESHIPGALLLPLDQLEALAPERLPDTEAVIYLYCRSGNRSAQAARLLEEMGYTRLYDLGGIQQWPYETVSGPEVP